MTQMLNRTADLTSVHPTTDADRVLPRFDVVAAEPPAESLRREHEVVEAIPDCAHTEHAAPDTLRAGEDLAAQPAEHASLSGAMCGCPILTT